MNGTARMVVGAGIMTLSELYINTPVYESIVNLGGGVLLTDGLSDIITGESYFFMNSLTRLVKNTFRRNH